MKSRSKALKQTAKNEGTQPSPGRPIDMIPKSPERHTLRIQKAHNGGYAITHETSHNGNYAEKVHVAQNSAHLKKIICKIAC